MSSQDITQQLILTINELSKPQALQGLFHEHRDGDPLPSASELEEIISLARSILFPGVFGEHRYYKVSNRSERWKAA